MKKGLAILLALVLTLGVSSLALAEQAYELALITDIGSINDKSFNEGAWEGLKAYAEANGITYDYIQPPAQGDDIYVESIDFAVAAGAKLIVTPGFLFEVPIYIVQEKYPDVTFILLDGSPHSADYSDFLIGPNTLSIMYAEEQAGYLAGYAAVKDGYRSLGFMGGMAVDAVVRFGHGFVQGAEAAAAELGVDEIFIRYHYTGDFKATPEVQAMAASWYSEGIEVIFACGGPVGNSVMAAAEAADKKVIGVDKDQSFESKTVITSATKGLSASVEQAITAYYNGEFPGGQQWNQTAALGGVGLPMETSLFETFTQEDYDDLFAKLVAGEIEIDSDVNIDVTDLNLEIVTVREIK